MGASSPEVNRRAGKTIRERKKALLHSRKAAVGCPCGESDPIVLDLHHRDPESKSQRLRGRGRGLWAKLSYEEIAVELEKCDVLCANCHRRKTYGGDQIAA